MSNNYTRATKEPKFGTEVSNIKKTLDLAIEANDSTTLILFRAAQQQMNALLPTEDCISPLDISGISASELINAYAKGAAAKGTQKAIDNPYSNSTVPAQHALANFWHYGLTGEDILTFTSTEGSLLS